MPSLKRKLHKECVAPNGLWASMEYSLHRACQRRCCDDRRIRLLWPTLIFLYQDREAAATL